MPKAKSPPSKRAARDRRYYTAHKDTIRKRQAKYYEQNQETIQAYYRARQRVLRATAATTDQGGQE
jgi:hypothetical protein